jgi:hypothetical protein
MIMLRVALVCKPMPTSVLELVLKPENRLFILLNIHGFIALSYELLNNYID